MEETTGPNGNETIEVESIDVGDDLLYVVVDVTSEVNIEEATFAETDEPVAAPPFFQNTDANEFELSLANYMMNECTLYHIQRNPKKNNAGAGDKRNVEIFRIEHQEMKFDTILDACNLEGLHNEEVIGEVLSSRLLFEISRGLLDYFKSLVKNSETPDCDEASKKAEDLHEAVTKLAENFSVWDLEDEIETVEVSDIECEASQSSQGQKKLAELKSKRALRKKKNEVSIKPETIDGYRGDDGVDELLKFIDPEEYSRSIKAAKNDKKKKPKSLSEKPKKPKKTKNQKDKHEAPKNDESVKLN